jgi:regulator of sigma E protease
MLTLVAFIAALAVLIVFHEFGHYLAARGCGVKVLRFSIGFGQPLFKKQFVPGGTEWVIAAIPFGGFVKMLGEQDEAVAPEDRPRAFSQQSLGKRMLIVVAGPLANFLLAILIYWGLYLHGMPGQRPVLDVPAAGTPAAQAHFANWDIIERVANQPVQTWEDVNWLLAQRVVDGGTVEIGVRAANDQHVVRVLKLEQDAKRDFNQDFLGALGLAPAKTVQARFGKVLPGAPAEQAGIQPGDLGISVDGNPTPDWLSFSERIRAKPGQVVQLELLRDGRPLTVSMTPTPTQVADKTIGRIGVAPYLLVDVRYDFFSALTHGAVKTWDTSVFSLQMLGRMLIGQVSWSNLSGPITIAQYAGETAQMGWLPYLLFIALVSVSLGVINLLPVPILDGGHLMYYMAEMIRGRPVSERAMMLGQRVGIAALVLLMTVALYNDIARQLTH